MNTPLVIIIIIWIYIKYSQSISCAQLFRLDRGLMRCFTIFICASERSLSPSSSHWRCRMRTDLNFNDCLRKKKVWSRWTECANDRDTFSELDGLSNRYLHGIFSSFFLLLFCFVVKRTLSHEEWRRYYSQETYSFSLWLRIMLILLRCCRLNSILFWSQIPNLW